MRTGILLVLVLVLVLVHFHRHSHIDITPILHIDIAQMSFWSGLGLIWSRCGVAQSWSWVVEVGMLLAYAGELLCKLLPVNRQVVSDSTVAEVVAAAGTRWHGWQRWVEMASMVGVLWTSGESIQVQVQVHCRSWALNTKTLVPRRSLDHLDRLDISTASTSRPP
jgi:hypothetical protein